MRQFPPAPFAHLNLKLVGGTLDTLPSFVALFIAHSFHLVKASDRIPNMRRIMQRLFALLRESIILAAQFISFFFVDLAHTE
jgi:hypothetical protein